MASGNTRLEIIMLQHQRTEIVANCGFQSRAAAREPLRALDQFGQQAAFRRGKEIYAEGTTADHCYKIVSGSVRLVKLMADGHRQICEFLVAGDLFGFEGEDHRYFAAEAVSDCVLVRYNRRNVDTLIVEDPAFARHMRHLASKGLEAAYKRMVLLCHKTAHERVAWFLLEHEESLHELRRL
jgi:CRP-like cAMP-binding protein